MILYNQSTGTFVTKHIPITRKIRHIVASRHLQSIEICPHSISYGRSSPELVSFSLFGNLPPELRAYVWALVFLEPHLVELELVPFIETASSPLPSLFQWSLRNKTPHPLLSTCIESREEVFKVCRSSGYSRSNSLGINFAIDSSFLRNLDYGSGPDYWPPPMNSGYKVPLLSIFECVESLVISRESILDAECEAENIIRRWFPNLCLLMVTLKLHPQDKLSLNPQMQLFQHPEDNHHISIFGSALSTCYWDAVYASRVKANMQRRFARQERIYKSYIAPIVKVVSVQTLSNHGEI
ncbi:hypothetical protein MFRU_067g00240 [Monilinia fructicola]|nr:hypothetical protein MFRU_067g00240 [Monilinia fructicola]